jgi:lysophospholipase L1-like esterase
MSRAPRKLFVALASLVVFFGAAEIVLRVVGYQLPPLEVPLIIWNPEEDKRLADGEALHEAAARQLWQPRPGAPVPWGEIDGEHINPFGYRGPVIAKEKTPGVLRIATFGDSSTFGMGVRWQETYSAKLVDELGQRGVRSQVIDAGVIGFTVEQGFERYLELVRDLKPDVVTLAFGACNEHFATRDLEDREKIAETSRRAAERRPVIDWVRENVRVVYPFVALQEWRRGVDRKKLYAELGAKRSELRKGEKGMGSVDWPGKRRVSVARFEEDLARFVETARADGAKTVVLISMTRHAEALANAPVLLEYNAAVERVGVKTGAPVFDARARIAAELAGGAKWEQLFVDFYHPSPKGHALFARELADLIAAAR